MSAQLKGRHLAAGARFVQGAPADAKQRSNLLDPSNCLPRKIAKRLLHHGSEHQLA